MSQKVASPGQEEFMANYPGTMLNMALVGGAGRGLYELKNLIGRGFGRKITPPPAMMVNVPYNVPQPEPEDEELDEQDAAELAKRQKIAGIGSALKSWFSGENADSQWDMPGSIPAYALGAPLAAVGGWKLTGALADMMRKRQQEKELEDAKKELYEGELGSFKPIELGKIASDCRAILSDSTPESPEWQKVAVALDKLYDVMRKNADLLSTLAGTGLLAGGISSMATAPLAYQYFRQSDPNYLRAKATRDQIEELNQSQAPSIVARLVPTMNGKPLPKRKVRQLVRTEPELLAPGTEKHAAVRPDLEAKAAAFVRQLFGAN